MDIQNNLITKINQNPGKLRQWLQEYFYDEDKLKNLCQDLNIRYYALAGQGINKANDLAEHLVTREKIPQLIDYLEQNDSDLVPRLFNFFGVRETNNSPTIEVPEKSQTDIITEEAIPSNFDYHVAISFASEDRVSAGKLAEILTKKGLKVFYDEYEQANLWGKDLYQHFQSIFRDKARYCIVFLSEAYSQKVWTNHELKQMQARAFAENSVYILPLRVDDTEIPGINKTTGYIDLRQFSLEHVANVFEEKLNNS
ncbi:MAG: toll/interleukin-1 receptor domain-containing protein [Rivularia sp. (in: cyanobacteria)]